MDPIILDASRPGELVQFDCFYIGRLSGDGAAWQYTAIDVASSYTWAEIHVIPKNPSSRYTSALARRVAKDLADRGWRLEVRSLTDPLTGQATTFTYTPSLRLETMVVAGSLTHSYGYDPEGRRSSEVVTASGGAEVARFEVSYDARDNVTARTRQIAGAPSGNGTTTYGYDDASRLVKETRPSGAVTTYGYDAAGNRTKVTEDGTEVTTSYDQHEVAPAL